VDFSDQKFVVDIPPPERGTRVWLITFTDLVALMLTFFVMLFAMSNVKLTEWRSIIDSLSQTLRPESVKTVPAPSSAFNIGTIFRKRATDIDYLASVLGEAIEGHGVLSQGRIARLDDRLVIALSGDSLFEPDGSGLTENGRQALFVLGGVLRNIGNQIAVNGHADITQAARGYASAWELATARAATAANALRQSGYTDDIVAFGFADATNGAAVARRIEIVIRQIAAGSS
jgi:chemotaxis protein MotB